MYVGAILRVKLCRVSQIDPLLLSELGANANHAHDSVAVAKILLKRVQDEYVPINCRLLGPAGEAEPMNSHAMSQAQVAPVDPAPQPARPPVALSVAPDPRFHSAPSPARARIVMVDDEPTILEVLQIHLEEAGYSDVTALTDSSHALELLQVDPPDILLTDLMMPTVDGLQLLAAVRADPHLAHLPVIVLTSSRDGDLKFQALNLGANDFLSKPVDPSELILRLRNNIAIKHYQDQLAEARRESDVLLRSILPEPVAERLKRGESVTDHFEDATVLFADLVNFTDFASRASAPVVVDQLNEIFRTFDRLVESRGLEKIKTIGDSYMLAGGVPVRRADHASAVVDTALAMIEATGQLCELGRACCELRIGVHTGPLVAGVIGTSKFSYDLWGDTVNVASRMESQGVTGSVQISEATRAAIGGAFDLEARGPMDIKGKGMMNTWFVTGRRS